MNCMYKTVVDTSAAADLPNSGQSGLLRSLVAYIHVGVLGLNKVSSWQPVMNNIETSAN